MSARGLERIPSIDGAWEVVLNALPHPVLLINARGFVEAANDAAQGFFQASITAPFNHSSATGNRT